MHRNCHFSQYLGCPGSADNQAVGDHRSAAIDATAADTMGGYYYLGYPQGTTSVQFSPLVDKMPGLLRLVQAAHRLHRAAEVAKTPDPAVGSTDCATLERTREDRRRLEVETGAAVNTAALEAVCRRMGKGVGYVVAGLAWCRKHPQSSSFFHCMFMCL